MAKPKARLPNLANVTAPTLIDWVAVVRRRKSEIETLEKYLSKALKARQKTWPASGKYFLANQESVTQERINAEKCREILDSETLEKVTTEADFSQTRFSELPGLTPEIEQQILKEAMT